MNYYSSWRWIPLISVINFEKNGKLDNWRQILTFHSLQDPVHFQPIVFSDGSFFDDPGWAWLSAFCEFSDWFDCMLYCRLWEWIQLTLDMDNTISCYYWWSYEVFTYHINSQIWGILALGLIVSRCFNHQWLKRRFRSEVLKIFCRRPP